MSRMPVSYTDAPRRFFHIKEFGGIDQSLDEGDMTLDGKVYTKDGYGFPTNTSNLAGEYIDAESLGVPTGGAVRSMFIWTWIEPTGGTKAHLFVHKAVTSSSEVYSAQLYPNYDQSALTWTLVPGGELMPADDLYNIHSINYRNGTTELVIFAGKGTSTLFYYDGTSIKAITDTGSPEKASLVELHKERVWAAGGYDYPDRIYFSDDLNPLEWTSATDNAGVIDVPTWDGESITALKAYNDALYIFKQNSIHRITGDTYADFNLSQVSENVGAYSQECVAILDDTCFVLNQNGLYAFNGSSAAPVFQNELRSMFTEIGDFMLKNPTQKTYASLTAFQGKLYINYGTATIRCIEIDLANGKISSSPTKERLSGRGVHVIPHGNFSVIFPGVQQSTTIVKAESPRGLGLMGGTSFRFTTGTSDFGDPAHHKRIKEITVIGSNSSLAGDGGVRITPICDGVEGQAVDFILPATRKTVTKRVTIRGKLIQLVITPTDSSTIVNDILGEYTVQGV